MFAATSVSHVCSHLRFACLQPYVESDEAPPPSEREPPKAEQGTSGNWLATFYRFTLVLFVAAALASSVGPVVLALPGPNIVPSGTLPFLHATEYVALALLCFLATVAAVFLQLLRLFSCNCCGCIPNRAHFKVLFRRRDRCSRRRLRVPRGQVRRCQPPKQGW